MEISDPKCISIKDREIRSDKLFKTIKRIKEEADYELFIAENQYTNEIIEVKKIAKTLKTREKFKLEVEILKELKTSNYISKFIRCYSDVNNYFITTKKLNGNNLLKTLIKMNLNEKIISNIIKQILLSIKECHNKNIIHGSININNFIFDNKILKLTNFTNAKIIKNENEYLYSIKNEEPYFISPEMILNNKQNGFELKKSDMWSVGIILYILIVGQPPFFSNRNTEIYNKILNNNIEFPIEINKIISENTKQFLYLLLNKNVNMRINCDDALKHEFIVKNDNLKNVLFDDTIKNGLICLDKELKIKNVIRKILLKELNDENDDNINEAKIMFKLLGNKNGGLDIERLIKYVLV